MACGVNCRSRSIRSGGETGVGTGARARAIDVVGQEPVARLDLGHGAEQRELAAAVVKAGGRILERHAARKVEQVDDGRQLAQLGGVLANAPGPDGVHAILESEARGVHRDHQLSTFAVLQEESQLFVTALAHSEQRLIEVSHELMDADQSAGLLDAQFEGVAGQG